MSDYEGHVVVLDFFAWWCGPCRTSSPDIEKNIYQYFKEREGNKYGVPVTVIGNTEASYPDRTDQFIKDSGLKLSADDLQGVAYGQFNEEGYIPLFVIATVLQEIATTQGYDYEGSAAFRNEGKNAAKFFIHPKNVWLSELFFASCRYR